MLCLTIKPGYYVMVGVTRITNNGEHNIRLAFAAPPSIVIQRQEVIEQMQREAHSRLAEIDVDG